jgi:hypothetical protein
MATIIDPADLPSDVKRQLRIRPRKNSFSKDAVRKYAIRALAPLAELTPDQRRRVLEHALKLNRV